MAVVKFTDVDSFLDELRKEKGRIEGRVVRLQAERRRDELFVIATVQMQGTILRLDCYCGSFEFSVPHPLSSGHDNTAVGDRWDTILRQLEEQITHMEFEVRSGIIEA